MIPQKGYPVKDRVQRGRRSRFRGNEVYGIDRQGRNKKLLPFVPFMVSLLIGLSTQPYGEQRINQYK